MSAQQLADACENLGFPLSRSALANFESGRRPTVSVAELIVLGKALGVPPILLIFPVGQEDMFEVLPGQEAGTWAATKWFTGEEAFPTQFPDGKWGVSSPDADAWEQGAGAVVDYRFHDELVRDWRRSDMRARAAQKAARVAKTPEDREAHRSDVKDWESQHRADERSLREHRKSMRRRGIAPPEMWGALADIDQVPEEER